MIKILLMILQMKRLQIKLIKIYYFSITILKIKNHYQLHQIHWYLYHIQKIIQRQEQD